ncbi:hypothetical protein FNV65_06445 [Streptomyces sp. S1A1-8]|nr:hypothetical protein FNV64_09440 [Streptomyces sp. S1A1-7]QDN85432.1 hypothetical protein FNV61_07025 [Streptomyces sp. RLB3-6]QDN95991.1 hypothetical protein FNV58_07875 [Streptomyces sp. RLB1-9]QDO06285.1 hypothetical protein FNV68_08470 [Streptomyces sp. S1D4-23]QDO17712.1 hypothetical protein FNV65_06445 [Streptomyces sp. S1A1-8]QDO27838.1 hypothetical protein FNV63_06435 [Streptomyces sp. S1A1-3]
MRSAKLGSGAGQDVTRSCSRPNAAIAAYIRWRNACTGPKTNFAPASPIRSWTEYPAKAA